MSALFSSIRVHFFQKIKAFINKFLYELILKKTKKDTYKGYRIVQDANEILKIMPKISKIDK